MKVSKCLRGAHRLSAIKQDCPNGFSSKGPRSWRCYLKEVPVSSVCHAAVFGAYYRDKGSFSLPAGAVLTIPVAMHDRPEPQINGIACATVYGTHQKLAGACTHDTESCSGTEWSSDLTSWHHGTAENAQLPTRRAYGLDTEPHLQVQAFFLILVRRDRFEYAINDFRLLVNQPSLLLRHVSNNRMGKWLMLVMRVTRNDCFRQNLGQWFRSSGTPLE